MPVFSHLHCHTQFSLLDGAADISKLMKKAKADGMPAVALTDHGNMFGAFKFVAEASKNDIKPIVGCEFYMVENRLKKEFSKEDKDVRNHQLLLAKNQEGYKNLAKLCSLGYMEGLYSKWPRIDKEILLKYHTGLIATTCCIGAEVPQAILHQNEEIAEQKFKWWLDLFGEDYYVELQRHKLDDQEKVNAVLLRFAAKYNVKVIASNDSHYVNQDDANAHDILLCVNTGELQSKPVWKGDGFGGKDYRFGFPNNEFYFKNTAEMSDLFKDLPQAIDNTNEIVDKIDTLKLKKDILLPNFPIPPGFTDGDDYLHHLTYEGAKRRYNGLPLDAVVKPDENLPLPQEVVERLDFELHTIKTMGFAGYFLIVSDFIKAGRELGVMIGPGRGSAAGSAVAYCIGITNLDPVKYQLLFERFLNPDRKSMPDIDTDFDDAGRQKVIDYVVEKYGRNQVAQIITYGTMATKSAIKDVARVMEYPLMDTNILTKLIPDKPTYGINFQKLIHMPLEDLADIVTPDELENVKKVRQLYNGKDLAATVLREAEKLEGTVRNTGIHAAGIIIAPDDLTNILPVSTAKDSDLLVTQFDGKVIEDAGVIKMDFLGLRNLTIIRDCLNLIKRNHGVEIEIDNIPLDDVPTYELFQRGETNAVFQFESDGMKKYMKDLKPDRFDDLIAMNALYRPGPIAYIPNYVNRKHGREEVTYDLPEMEEFLKDTYGITVYQEQVMLLSQKLAGFTKGDADVLRKAMGKKDRKTLDKLKPQFINSAKAKGLSEKKLEKIWTDWEAFASYAFNKSHSTCYAFVAYQTAYLKTHYAAEYMAAVMTSCLGNIEKITFFMEECKRAGIPVLGPDVNESSIVFDVNKAGQIRFGLGAIKGAGEAAVGDLINERETNGPYKDIFDLTKRVNLRTVNKKTFESLAYGGAFDSFGLHRAQYFADNGGTLIEKAIKFGNQAQSEKGKIQQSLFGGADGGGELPPPRVMPCEQWTEIERLKHEKEVVGFYISGHPLDQYRIEMSQFAITPIDQVENFKNREINIAGIITKTGTRISKSGNPFTIFTLEDYNASMEIALFGENHVKFANYLQEGGFIFIKGKYEPRFFNSTDQFEFKPQQMQLLSEMRQKLCKGVQLSLDLTTINATVISKLADLAKNYPGDCELRISLSDSREKMQVEGKSRLYRINPSNELIKEIEEMDGVVYKLVW
ncbi:DNA polymerase III subunit alpha [Cytophagaceae bacterium DM2B3-1]|uniref:DNA polymerase III subunit alpha n=1 Tax=Xanthocytophaga flava TaxID=3048013 RepID=A0ABT7CW32_9BACT|nr:DNA polymerase III subunit alpha [Xanthocytophaga flavus]MDJ1497989.1 DNA polymerase III subunit alpha [Xanthocytophaga flavus]